MGSGFALWGRYALGNPVMLCALSSWRGEDSIGSKDDLSFAIWTLSALRASRVTDVIGSSDLCENFTQNSQANYQHEVF